ncbi:MAG: hypothetical protein JXB36_07005 [Gammaproteobacteria bacterium]|nr:hypothetical protein [Gammaproteobacteria bacterium]
MNRWDRRSVLKGLGAVGTGLWAPLSADALGLSDDRIKVIAGMLMNQRPDGSFMNW